MLVCPSCMLQVRLLGEQSDIFKHIRKDSNKWEVARPPNEVRACTRCHTQDTCTFSRSIRGGRALPPGHMQVTIEAWRQGGKGAALLAKHALHPTSRQACVHACRLAYDAGAAIFFLSQLYTSPWLSRRC